MREMLAATERLAEGANSMHNRGHPMSTFTVEIQVAENQAMIARKSEVAKS